MDYLNCLLGDETPPEVPSNDACLSSESTQTDSEDKSEERVFSPAFIGRYMLSTSLDYNHPVLIELKAGSKLDVVAINAYKDLHSPVQSTENLISMIESSAPVYSRDFLVLLALIKIQRTKSLHLSHLDGGISFLAREVRDILGISSGGANTTMIREAIERLATLSFRITVKDRGDIFVLHEFNIFDAVDIGEKQEGQRTYSSRHWHIRFNNTFRLILGHDCCEQTGHTLKQLLEVRKSPTSIASIAHYQSISYGELIFDKRFSTFLKNINSPIDDNLWRTDASYRSKIASRFRRAFKHIKAEFKNSVHTLLTLPNQLVSFRTT